MRRAFERRTISPLPTSHAVVCCSAVQLLLARNLADDSYKRLQLHWWYEPAALFTPAPDLLPRGPQWNI